MFFHRAAFFTIDFYALFRILQNPDVKRLLQNRTKQQDSAVAAMHLPQHEHDPNAVHHDKGSKKTAHNHKN